jgi:putative ABC transport system permease protein
MPRQLVESIAQAFASARAHTLRSLLGAAAVAVAVATVALVVTALDGVARYARASAARAFGSDTFVVARIASPGQISRRELELKLERNPAISDIDVRFLARYADALVDYGATVQRSADVTAGARTYENAAVIGATASLAAIRDLGVEEGRFFGPQEEAQAAQVAVIGADVADALFPSSDPIGRTIRVAGRGFRVIGVQARQGNLGGTALDRDVWVPLGAWERAFGPAGTLQVLARPRAAVPGPSELVAAEDRARASMRARRQLGPDRPDNFDILTPDAARTLVLRLSERIGIAAVPISAMALLAAIIVVANTILVSVSERTREIGVRRAIGASRRQILREVLAESSLLSLSGGLAGVVLVSLAVRLVVRVSGVDLELRWSTAAWTLLAAGASGLVAGWYPARRATRVEVVTALRAD